MHPTDVILFRGHGELLCTVWWHLGPYISPNTVSVKTIFLVEIPWATADLAPMTKKALEPKRAPP